MWWWALVACGEKPPEFTVGDFTLVGVWAVAEPDSGVATATTRIEFVDDGTWALLDPGDRCDEPPFQSWFCEGAGGWSLTPDTLLQDDPTTLFVTFEDVDETPWHGEGSFSAPSRFCWEQTLLGTECIVRE